MSVYVLESIYMCLKMKYPAIASDCHLLSPVVQAVKVPSHPSKLRIDMV